MTLLSICQAACATAPVAVPPAIINNTDETAVLLLGLANDAGDELARKPEKGWVSMIREYEFYTASIASQSGTIANVGSFGQISGLTGIGSVVPFSWIVTGTGVPRNAIVTAVTPTTVTFNQPATSTGAGTFQFGQSDYTLPTDFSESVDGTFWDRSMYWQMRGPQSPQQWQTYKSSVIGTASIQKRFRFRTIRDAAGGVPVTKLSIDPVPFGGPSYLVFEYLSNGWCQSSLGVPQSQWLADTDTGVIDEYLLRLSIKYRLLRRLGMSYSEELDEYSKQADRAVAGDGGAMVLNMAQRSGIPLISPWSVPETGYGQPFP